MPLLISARVCQPGPLSVQQFLELASCKLLLQGEAATNSLELQQGAVESKEWGRDSSCCGRQSFKLPPTTIRRYQASLLPTPSCSHHDSNHH